MFEPLLTKTAEPPPPKGVSSKAWDKILQKGPKTMPKTADVDLLRKAAADLTARSAFEELTNPEALCTEEIVVRAKLASIEDPELYASAYGISTDEESALETYEALGGTYKHAFGAQMFDTKQMAGSPAVSGGMSARANTRMPQMQQAPVSVTTTSIGQNNGQGGTAAPTSQTSTPSAPTG